MGNKQIHGKVQFQGRKRRRFPKGGLRNPCHRPTAPTKTSYVFAGGVFRFCANHSIPFSTPIFANKTLYAKWKYGMRMEMFTLRLLLDTGVDGGEFEDDEI